MQQALKYDDYTDYTKLDITATSISYDTTSMDAKQTFSLGHMVQNNDNEKWSFAGKVFGRLGSGDANLPDTQTAFRYDQDTKYLAYMYISIFPNHGNITHGDSDIFSYKDINYVSLETFDPPSKPSTPAEPEYASAKTIMASMGAAALAVYATML